jgi:hypothetical protein
MYWAFLALNNAVILLEHSKTLDTHFTAIYVFESNKLTVQIVKFKYSNWEVVIIWLLFHSGNYIADADSEILVLWFWIELCTQLKFLYLEK